MSVPAKDINALAKMLVHYAETVKAAAANPDMLNGKPCAFINPEWLIELSGNLSGAADFLFDIVCVDEVEITPP